MDIIKKTYLFNKFFNYHIDYLYNHIFIYIKDRYLSFKIPSYYFFKKGAIFDKFIFINRFHFLTFLNHLFNFYNRFFLLYYYKLTLKGLGYRVFKISNFLYKFFLNRSNFFYLHLPSCVLLKYRTRHFFFISTQKAPLKVTILYLLFLKEFVVYRLSGIFYPRQIILMKPGKNKFR